MKNKLKCDFIKNKGINRFTHSAFARFPICWINYTSPLISQLLDVVWTWNLYQGCPLWHSDVCRRHRLGHKSTSCVKEIYFGKSQGLLKRSSFKIPRNWSVKSTHVSKEWIAYALKLQRQRGVVLTWKCSLENLLLWAQVFISVVQLVLEL